MTDGCSLYQKLLMLIQISWHCLKWIRGSHFETPRCRCSCSCESTAVSFVVCCYLHMFLLVPRNTVSTDPAVSCGLTCFLVSNYRGLRETWCVCVQCHWRTSRWISQSWRRASVPRGVSWRQLVVVVLRSRCLRNSSPMPSIRWTHWTPTARRLRLMRV